MTEEREGCVKRKAEVGVLQPQERLEPPGAGKDEEGRSPRAFRRATLISDFCLQNYETTDFIVLSHQFCDRSFRQP